VKRRRLGTSGLFVTTVGLGCDNFGMLTNRDEAVKVVHKALGLGIEYFDTADTYGNFVSEECVGEGLKGHRHEVIVGSKVGMPWGKTPNQTGTSRLQIMRQLEGSLRRLQTDYIDVYHLHVPDGLTPIEETLRAADDCVRQGKVRYLALSNFNAWQACEAVLTARMLNLHGFVSCQSYYNMLRRRIEADLVPFCEKYGLNLMPYFPLEGGLLAGKYTRGEPPPAGTRMGQMNTFRSLLKDTTFDTVEKLKQFCDERGKHLVELALAWLLAQPQVATVIPGATKLEQVEVNVKAAEWDLTPEELGEIEKIAPRSNYAGYNIPTGRTEADPLGVNFVSPDAYVSTYKLYARHGKGPG